MASSIRPNYEKYEVIRDIKLLKQMEKKGFVKFHHQTGTKIHGLYDRNLFTCTYVDEAHPLFEFNGNFYGQKYFDGCFCPYVVKYEKI